MSDLRSLLDRAIGPVDPSLDRGLQMTLRRAGQRQRRRRLGAIALALVASVVSFGFAVWALSAGRGGQPAAVRGAFMFVGGDNLTGEYRLYTMSADGTDLRSIPTGDLVPFAAAPSVDGERVALIAAEPWPRGAMPNLQLFLMDADSGRLEEVPACPEDGCKGTIQVSWSPDGQFLAFPGDGVGIHVLDVRTGASQKLTGGSLDYDAVWSPDGTRIAFARTEPSVEPRPNAQIWVMNVDGTGAHQLTDETFAHEATQPAWSPDGTRIAYTEGGEPGGTAGVAVVNVDGSAARQLTSCTFGSCDRFPTFPIWSPDGSAIGVLMQEGGLTNTAVAVVDPETGDLRVVRELPFSASTLAWQAER